AEHLRRPFRQPAVIPLEYVLPATAFLGILLFFWGVSSMMGGAGPETLESRMARYAGGPQVAQEKKQTQKKERREIDTFVLLSNSLRAGSSFLQSVELVSRESPAPMGPEMGRVVREVNLGLGMEEALANMVRRIKSDDLDLMVTAIGVQQQVGGNLAE